MMQRHLLWLAAALIGAAAAQPSHLEVHAPTGSVVLFGGVKPTVHGFDTFSETWVFDPFEERWSQLSFEGPTPRAEIGEEFAYHEAADPFVLHGGLTLNGFRVLDDA